MHTRHVHDLSCRGLFTRARLRFVDLGYLKHFSNMPGHFLWSSQESLNVKRLYTLISDHTRIVNLHIRSCMSVSWSCPRGLIGEDAL